MENETTMNMKSLLLRDINELLNETTEEKLRLIYQYVLAFTKH